MIEAQETFGGTFPFTPHFSEAPGFRMHYVDEGEGQPVVLLHGEPTWGYLYRRFIGPLARDYRVIVPDHMGFGKSETPQDRAYTLREHVANLRALVNELDLTDIVFVAQDWGGPIASAFTVEEPDRVARIFYMNTATGIGDVNGSTPPITSSRWFRWIEEGRENGRVDAVLGNLGSTMLSVLRLIGFEKISVATDEWVRAYAAAFPDTASCIGAISFPLDIAEGRALEYLLECRQRAEVLTQKTAMLVEGMADQAVPPAFAMADFHSLWPEGRVVELPNVGHYVQEDAHDIVLPLLRQFLEAQPELHRRRRGRTGADAAGAGTGSSWVRTDVDERIDESMQQELDKLLTTPTLARHEHKADVGLLVKVLERLEALEFADTAEQKVAVVSDLPEHVDGADELDPVLASIKTSAATGEDDRAVWQQVRAARRSVILHLSESIEGGLPDALTDDAHDGGSGAG